jgi:hypothetical protein
MKKLWILVLFNAVLVTPTTVLTVRKILDPYPWLPILAVMLFLANFLIVRSILTGQQHAAQSLISRPRSYLGMTLLGIIYLSCVPSAIVVAIDQHSWAYAFQAVIGIVLGSYIMFLLDVLTRKNQSG